MKRMRILTVSWDISELCKSTLGVSGKSSTITPYSLDGNKIELAPHLLKPNRRKTNGATKEHEKRLVWRVDELMKEKDKAVKGMFFLSPKLHNSCFIRDSNFKRFCPVLYEGNKSKNRRKNIREGERKNCYRCWIKKKDFTTSSYGDWGAI